MESFGFTKPEGEQPKKWYKLAGRVAKLSEYQVEALEFVLFSVYNEHIKIEEDTLRNQQEIADMYNGMTMEEIREYLEKHQCK